MYYIYVRNNAMDESKIFFVRYLDFIMTDQSSFVYIL